jgi:hypothetical protein
MRPRPTTFGLVDARELASALGVSVDYVYGHSTQLDAVRLGSGRKARIRFDIDVARRALDESLRRLPGRPRKNGA